MRPAGTGGGSTLALEFATRSARRKQAPRTIFRLVSLWALIALIAVMVLEVLPATGPRLAAVGGPFVAGWLVHFCLLSLFFEALAGRFPVAAALVPVLAYSSYYLEYWEQSVHARQKSAELRRSNPGRILDFNADTYSLVMDKADKFGASHEIPIVFTRDSSYKPEGYVSFRLWPTDKLGQFLEESHATFQVLAVYWDGLMQPAVKELRVAERPPHRIVEATVHDDPGDGWKDWNLGEEATTISAEGKAIGVFKSSYVFRLPKLPFLTIGCRYSVRPRLPECDANFITERVSMESVPEGVDRGRYDDPVSIMLGIRKITDDEILSFHGFAAGADAAGPVAARSDSGEDEAFETLRAVIKGQSPAIAWTTGHTIASDPVRLAPLAAGMAKRFIALSQPDKTDAPGRREQAALLSTGLVALPKADFVAVADQLRVFMRRGGSAEEHPALYLRLADGGPNMFSFYRDRFLAPETSRLERLLAALAICRIGQADSELISAMTRQWSGSEAVAAGDDNYNYKAALFVTLLKLGREDVLRKADDTDSETLKTWYEAVLALQGKTEAGPNNCMPMEWPRAEYLPPSLSPRLRWSHEKWLPVAQK
jgi:hypothetical protein